MVLARALAVEPDLLVLDETLTRLSALDERLGQVFEVAQRAHQKLGILKRGDRAVLDQSAVCDRSGDHAGDMIVLFCESTICSL